ncbi:GGDEF domain-containing protein [Shewanella canadensis]|uniref:diguanylate cyclase n=1 Tax=Shewanella canadensis TaxID=271096 RepID=A0A3S0KTP5_9GAMM|nr:GGDEF domain-containing protein [Shewanella canadensis]RTR38154.1 GGDEF domain-containing protein [Shewanella canadensis]
MSAFYHRCRYFFLPLLATAFSLGLLQFTQANWQIWQGSINQLPFWLLVTATALALQFNRSRLAYLAMLLLLFYADKQHHLLPSSLSSYTEALFLGGAMIITCFSFFKDRGLLSPHSLVRVFSIFLCFGMAYGWLWGIEHFQAEITAKLPLTLSFQLQAALPLYLCGLLVLTRTLWQANLVNTSILITFVIWVFYDLYPGQLPLSVLCSALAVIYLFTILIDSYFLAYRDELTGLASRRALYNLVLSLGRKYSVAMLDIDHFKKFNDTYGHDVGDQVLKLVAAKLAQVSGGGKVFRYGGEEFTIVFPRKDTDSVIDHLEDVRESIEEYRIVLRDDKRKQNTKAKRNAANRSNKKTVSVTISIGVAERQGGETFDQTMKQADEALYRAKKKGRNQLCT